MCVHGTFFSATLYKKLRAPVGWGTHSVPCLFTVCIKWGNKKSLASKHWLRVGRLFGLEKIINLHLWHWTSFVLLKKSKALNSFLTLPLPSSQKKKKLDPQQRGKRKIYDTFRVIYRNTNYQGPGRVRPSLFNSLLLRRTWKQSIAARQFFCLAF